MIMTGTVSVSVIAGVVTFLATVLAGLPLGIALAGYALVGSATLFALACARTASPETLSD
jgi:ABC-type spermidine/putrescine transport system permease subunit II